MTMTARTTSSPITLDTLKQAVPKIRTALDAFDRGVRIYRGLSHADGDFRYKPQMQFGSRVSANTENYYTLIVDHDPAWSDYPPRSASIIASSKLHVARGYGMTYVVLPEGDPQIGICNTADYWISFPRVGAISGHMDLSELNGIIRNMADKYAQIARLVPKDYTYLTQVLEIIDEQMAAEATDWRSYLNSRDWKMQEIAQFMTKTPEGTLLERLQWLLNPEANHFEQGHLSDLSVFTSNHEVWMHAGTYLINTQALPDDWDRDASFKLSTWIDQQ